jgi:phytoene dehydrogenase-like protein
MHHGLARPHLLLLVAALAAISMSEAVSHDPTGDPRRHVCIIGGGIAGATAVHYLANATRLTLFEASLRLGGRIASTQLAPGLRVEAGASVLAAENRLIGVLAADLGLARKEPGVGGGEVRLGLWDGRAFRYVSSGRPWVDAGRMLWRYGRPLLRMRRYVATLLDTFGGLYVGADAGHDTVEKLLARAPGLFDLTQKSFDKTAGAAFGGGQLVEELVSAVRWNVISSRAGLSRDGCSSCYACMLTGLHACVWVCRRLLE